MGLSVHRETYSFHDLEVSNVITEVKLCDRPTNRYLLGAHYDSVSGTVGADDNGSAVAVQLETARILNRLRLTEDLNIAVKFVSFALEEPPAFLTRYRGSRVHARKAKHAGEQIEWHDLSRNGWLHMPSIGLSEVSFSPDVYELSETRELYRYSGKLRLKKFHAEPL